MWCIASLFAVHPLVRYSTDHSWVLYLLCGLTSLLSSLSWGILFLRLLYTAQRTVMSCRLQCFAHCAMQCNVFGARGDFLVVGTHVRYYQCSCSALQCKQCWWHTCAIRGEQQLSALHYQGPDIEATILIAADITSSSNRLANLYKISRFLAENWKIWRIH